MSTNSSTQLQSEGRPNYGDPELNLGAAQKLKKVYRRTRAICALLVRKGITLPEDKVNAHDEAIEMILTKIARISTGTLNVDNYDDIIGYANLAKQLAGFNNGEEDNDAET